MIINGILILIVLSIFMYVTRKPVQHFLKECLGLLKELTKEFKE